MKLILMLQQKNITTLLAISLSDGLDGLVANEVLEDKKSL
jgi:hypothetical protein